MTLVIITGITGVPLLFFILPAYMCPVSSIVPGPDPIEKAVSGNGKVQVYGQELSQVTR